MDERWMVGRWKLGGGWTDSGWMDAKLDGGMNREMNSEWIDGWRIEAKQMGRWLDGQNSGRWIDGSPTAV